MRRPDGLVLLLTPPFDNTAHDPGYIKGYAARGSVKTAGNIPMLPRGRSWPSRRSAMAIRPANLFRMLNPINRTIIASERAALQSGAVRGCGRCLCRASSRRARRMDLVHRLGRLALSRRHGMDSGIPRARHDAFHRSLHSAKLARLLHQFSVSLGDLQDHGGKSISVTRGVALTELDGKVLAGSANIPLDDDGAEHQVLIVLG